jgi:hypothetical protein
VPVVVPRQPRRSSTRSLLIRRGEFLIVPPRPAVAGVGPVPPKLSRQAPRRLVFTRRGEFLPVPLVGAAPASPGFVCQDFTTTVSVDAYSGVATVDAYSATRTVDAYAGSFSVDAYTGSATNCGR